MGTSKARYYKYMGLDIMSFDSNSYSFLNVVKLHSELALPTGLQLDRVGVDFVFPPSQQVTSN